MSLLTDLFLTFAKIGLFTFGGGYAMIPLIRNACVEKKRWITHDEMMNVTVIAESTPGPIAINCATFVGYRQKGVAGAAAATAGIVLPSFCIIFLISMFLDHFLEITWIAHAFMGIRAAVGILIVDAAVKCFRKSDGHFDRTVCVVALSHVHQTGKSADRSEVQIIKAVFPAGEGQHDAVRRGLLDKIGVIAASGLCAVASAH